MSRKTVATPEKKKTPHKKAATEKKNLNAKQSLFLSYYLDPLSKTFSNAMQSAIRAGFSKSYAAVITADVPDWFSQNINDHYLVKVAEKNLKDFLEMDTKNLTVTKLGEVVEQTDAQLMKIKQDTTKFALERLNKEKYASRNELTGSKGGAIDFNTSPDALATLFKTFELAKKAADDNDAI